MKLIFIVNLNDWSKIVVCHSLLMPCGYLQAFKSYWKINHTFGQQQNNVTFQPMK